MEDEAVRCSRCQGIIGFYSVGPDGRVWLRIDPGGLLVQNLNGVHSCGLVWNFHTSDKALEDLMQRAKDKKNL